MLIFQGFANSRIVREFPPFSFKVRIATLTRNNGVYSIPRVRMGALTPCHESTLIVDSTDNDKKPLVVSSGKRRGVMEYKSISVEITQEHFERSIKGSPREATRIYSLACVAVCMTVRSCRSTSGPVISAGLKRTMPSLSTEQSGFSFHLMWIRPSSSRLVSNSLRRSFCSTSCRNLSFCGLLRCEFFVHTIPPIFSALFECKKGAGHWFVKTNNPAPIIL